MEEAERRDQLEYEHDDDAESNKLGSKVESNDK